MKFQATFSRPSRDYAHTSIGDITGPDRGEAGADSESWLTDLLGGGPDVNPELTGPAKFLQYDEMRKTDASVKSVLMFLKLPVRSATWSLDPKTDDPIDAAIRDMVAWNVGLEGQDGQMVQSWDKQLEQGLSMLEFGPCLEELIWEDVTTWYDADGDAHLVRPLARLAPRPSSSIDKVLFNPNGTVRRVEQNIAGTRPIPGDKLSYMVFEEEAGRWAGVSLLRPAWGPWRLKRALMIAAGIGWDRFSMGLPVVHHPDTPEGEARAKSIGRSIRGHQRAYVRFPIPQGMTKDESEWALEIVNGAQTLADPTPLLKWFCDQIAEAGLQQFTRQGMGETGARATAEVQVDPFFLAVQAIANNIRRERSRQVLRKIVEVNFGIEAAETRMPVLTVSRIQARNVSVVANAIGLLGAVGFTFTDREAQDDIREMLGLTKLPDDLDSMGIDRERLRQILAAQGLDETQLAEIVNGLPEEIGVARNRATPAREGDGLGARGFAAITRALEETGETIKVDLLERVGTIGDRMLALEQRPDVDLAPLEQRLQELADRIENIPHVDEGELGRELAAATAPLRGEIERLSADVARALEAKPAQPLEINVTVPPGDRRPTRARAVKDASGQTVVEYEYPEES